MKTRATAVLMLLSVAKALTQEAPSAKSSPIEMAPNVELPAQVKAEPGRLTLFADFSHRDKAGVPLFLVNRTPQKIDFDGESGQVYDKLERQLPSGEWERAQAHSYSDCGNSYGRTTLLPGTHFRTHGYQPAHGQPARIRYASYGTVPFVSNVGEGIFAPEDVRDAEMDHMAMRQIPSSLWICFHDNNPSLDEFEIPTRLAALRMTELIGEVPGIRVLAENWAERLEKTNDPTPEQWLALPELRALLKRDWGKNRGLGPLLKACFEAVKPKSQTTARMGTLEKESAFTWKIISEIGSFETRVEVRPLDLPKPDPGLWTEVLKLAASYAVTAENAGDQGILTLLRQARLVDEFLPDSALEAMLSGKKEAMVFVAAHALVRRDHSERVAELGFHQEPASQLVVLLALGLGPLYDDKASFGPSTFASQPAEGSKEQAFWSHVLKSQPVQAAAALKRCLPQGPDTCNPYEERLFESLKRYWMKEAERSAHENKDFEQSSSYPESVAFIAAWQSPENVPLLRSLLRYRGYESQRSSVGDPFGPSGKKPREIRHFNVRRIAAKALQHLDWPVPKNLVFDVEVK